MASKSYTLLEYLVALENKINELASNGTGSGGGTGNVDLTDVYNTINALETKHNSFESSTNVKFTSTNSKISSVENNFNSFKNTTNTNIQSANNNIVALEENKMNNLKKVDYFYVAKDNNNCNLDNSISYTSIKVYDDFNNYLLKENENYKKSNNTLTFNYLSIQKIRVEYY